MNRCSLCMTELHPQAVVCTGCGAQKEGRLGYALGCLMLGAGIIAVLLLMAGRFMAGAVFLLATFGIAYMAPKSTVWVRRSERSH